MAEIPSAVATPGQVGIDQPQPARTRVASINNPIGLGIEKVGADLGDVANTFQNTLDQQKQAQDSLDYSSATSALLKQKTTLESQFGQDPNFNTAPDRFTGALGKQADQISQTIRDPILRQKWMAEVAGKLSDSGWDNLTTLGQKKEADNGVAWINQTITDGMTQIQSAPDEATRQQILKNINLSIDAGQLHGWVSATDAQAKKQQVAVDYAKSLAESIQDPHQRLDYLTGSTAGSGHPAPSLPPALDAAITSASTGGPVGADTTRRFAQVESAGGTASPNIFQFKGALAQKYGITDSTPVADQIAAFQKALPEVQGAFTQLMGRAPTEAESYLAWQQGPAGAAALLKNPSDPAIATLTPLYNQQYGAGKGAAIAQQAILGNVTPGFRKASLSWTGQQFIDYWNQRYSNPVEPAQSVTANGPAPSVSDGTPRPGTLHLDPAIAPKVPQGAPRPFGMGEYVENPDGSTSNEITITVENPKLNGGKPTVLPSLWLVNGKAITVNEDTAARYAAQSGLTFPSFDNMKDADKFTDQREAAWQGIAPQDAGKVAPLWKQGADVSRETQPGGGVTTGDVGQTIFRPTGTPADMIPTPERLKLIDQANQEIRINDQQSALNASLAAAQHKQQQDSLVSSLQTQMLEHDADPTKPPVDLVAASKNPLLQDAPDAIPHLLAFQAALAKPDGEKGASGRNTSALFGKIAPSDGSAPLTQKNIDDAFISQDPNVHINKDDRDWLTKQLADANDPTGKAISGQANDVFKVVERQIDPSFTGAEGTSTHSSFAGTRMLQYRQAVMNKVAQFKKDGKDPAVLFDPTPGNKDYVGSPGFVAPYTRSLSDLMTEEMTGQESQPAAPIASGSMEGATVSGTPAAPAAVPVPPDLPRGTVYAGKLKDGRDAFRLPDGTLRAVKAPESAAPPIVPSGE